MTEKELNKNFDDQLKARLKSHDSTVPESVWTAIHDELHPKKTSRRWLLWLPIVLLVIGGITYFMLTTKSSEKKISSRDTSLEVIKSTEKQSQGLSQSKERNTAAKIAESNQRSSEKKQDNLLSQSQQKGSSQSDDTFVSSSHGMDSQKENKKASSAQNKKVDVAIKESDKTGITYSRKMETSSREQGELLNQSQKDKETASTSSDKTGAQSNTPSFNPSTVKVPDLDLTNAFEEATYLSNSFVVKPLRLKEHQLSALNLKAIKHCDIKNNGVYAYYVEMTLGPDYAHRILNLKNEDAQASFDLREKTESYLSAYHVNIEAGMFFGNGFLISGGLNYARINEKFSYVDPDAERDRLVQIVVSLDTITSSTGTDSIVKYVRDVAVTERGYREVKFANRLSTVGIPLTLGYHFRKERFLISTYFGTQINFASWQEGRYATLDGVQVLDKNSNIYKKGIGLGLIGGVGIHYHLKKGNYLTVKPNFYYSLIDIAHEDYFADQKYFKAGLQLGFRHVIQRKKTNK